MVELVYVLYLVCFNLSKKFIFFNKVTNLCELYVCMGVCVCVSTYVHEQVCALQLEYMYMYITVGL